MYLAIPRMSNIWFFSFHFRAQEQSFKSRAKEYKLINQSILFVNMFSWNPDLEI